MSAPEEVTAETYRQKLSGQRWEGGGKACGVGVAEGHVAVGWHPNLSCRVLLSVKWSPDKDGDRGGGGGGWQTVSLHLQLSCQRLNRGQGIAVFPVKTWMERTAVSHENTETSVKTWVTAERQMYCSSETKFLLRFFHFAAVVMSVSIKKEFVHEKWI